MAYFYHSQLRNLTIAFAAMFDHLTIRAERGNSGNYSEERVPIAYSKRSSYYQELIQDRHHDRRVATKLPRMGFALTGLQYDTERKTSGSQKIRNRDQSAFTYSGVPYNVNFELYVASKTTDEGLQIIEQILPFFDPYYTITLRSDMPGFDDKDVPIGLDGIVNDANYEGSIDMRRRHVWELQFTAKTTLYGPVNRANLIRRVRIDQSLQGEVEETKKYTIEPYIEGVAISDIKPNDDYGINIDVVEEYGDES